LTRDTAVGSAGWALLPWALVTPSVTLAWLRAQDPGGPGGLVLVVGMVAVGVVVEAGRIWHNRRWADEVSQR